MTKTSLQNEEVLEIYGARVHNLKNIDLVIPRNKLVVFTGLSGSGKSSLAFDTIYAEGQRRYMESFSAYARQFIGNMERPDVDKIDGLSPVIAIEQKTISRNPRSTVGTLTEIYDFLRLLYAKVGKAYSYESGSEMTKMTELQIMDSILKEFNGKNVSVLAPLIRARKGHYRELFEQYRKQGYTKMRIDGVIIDLKPDMKLDRFKTHDIELVIDRIHIDEAQTRFKESIALALKIGKGIIMILGQNETTPTFYSKFLMDAESGLAYDEPQPNTFSFNSPYGACPTCEGLGTIPVIDLELIFPNKELSISKGGIAPFGELRETYIFDLLKALSKTLHFSLTTPIQELPEDIIQTLLNGYDETLKLPSKYFSGFAEDERFEGIIATVDKSYNDTKNEYLHKWAQDFVSRQTCTSCGGARLKKEALSFKIDNKNIAQVTNFEINEAHAFISSLKDYFSGNDKLIATEILKEIEARLKFLLEIGLSYLSLDRPTGTLSGGESQRIRLATQIGSQLVGVLYILDEPSIGLHQRDNHQLIQSLKNLRDQGNSVLVVEHDKDMILESDFVVDIGPKAGIHGGEIVIAGTPDEVSKVSTLTTDYLFNRKIIPFNLTPREGNGKAIKVLGAKGHNLKNIDLEVPLGKFVVVSGVSGSGKSSLIKETLYQNLCNYFYYSRRTVLEHDTFEGIDNIDKVIEIDQDPIGRTPRSNPATYTGVFTPIRSLFADLTESKIRGYKPGRFSFNVTGGRCETCKGAGIQIIEMNFLPDVEIHCNECNGRRYNRETLDVRYKGKSISDVLDMSIEEAVHFFETIPSIHNKIKTIKDVGLGYIKLGQSSTTLSGGEAQRVKLASELSKKDTGNTLYILDEPTTGLHFDDVRVLLEVLDNLVDRGNTILVIEHNMDVIKKADHVIDIGPEGGKNGGYICFEGTVSEMIKKADSNHTALYLAKEFKDLNG